MVQRLAEVKHLGTFFSSNDVGSWKDESRMVQMPEKQFCRRQFLQTASAVAGATLWTRSIRQAAGSRTPNNRPKIGVVGCGSRWGWQLANGGSYGVGPEFAAFGDYVVVCDVDQQRQDAARTLVQGWNGSRPDATGDYRAVLERDDVDAVIIFTPDHWHAKVAIEAMLAGKDVYCEKPMTLTIEEGQQICEVCRRTGRVFQVGSQQRSDRRFQTAVAMLRDGRLGELKKVECRVGGGPTSPEVPTAQPPDTLNWNQWLGPAPKVAYRYLGGANNETKSWSRCHYEFRWWYEYSGGKLTDWGAHHVDIATWGMNKTSTGPVSIEPLMVEHPVPFENGYPTRDDCYNTATKFNIRALYEDGMELTIRHDERNGILFEGTKGRIFVNRGSLSGGPAEDLSTHPLPEGALEAINKNRPLTDSNGSSSRAHVQNFFHAITDRSEPISDVHSHHRALTTCHLAGIAARLGRKIAWDPNGEMIVDDEQAQALVGREKRIGFEIDM
jgi:predicted dehydrogenase